MTLIELVRLVCQHVPDLKPGDVGVAEDIVGARLLVAIRRSQEEVTRIADAIRPHVPMGITIAFVTLPPKLPRMPMPIPEER